MTLQISLLQYPDAATRWAAFPELYLESYPNALIALKDSDAIVAVVWGGRFLANKSRPARGNSDSALNPFGDAIASISNCSSKNAEALLRLNTLWFWPLFFRIDAAI
jgi:hypothetical protein